MNKRNYIYWMFWGTITVGLTLFFGIMYLISNNYVDYNYNILIDEYSYILIIPSMIISHFIASNEAKKKQ